MWIGQPLYLNINNSMKLYIKAAESKRKILQALAYSISGSIYIQSRNRHVIIHFAYSIQESHFSTGTRHIVIIAYNLLNNSCLLYKLF